MVVVELMLILCLLTRLPYIKLFKGIFRNVNMKLFSQNTKLFFDLESHNSKHPTRSYDGAVFCVPCRLLAIHLAMRVCVFSFNNGAINKHKSNSELSLYLPSMPGIVINLPWHVVLVLSTKRFY